MSDLHSLFPELGRWGTAGAVGAREHTEAGQRRGELGPAWWGATSRRCRFRCGRRSRCAVGLVEVEVFRRRPAGTRSAVRSPVPSPAKSPPAQAGIPFQPPEPIPHGGTAIDGAAAMTLVQVKRPDRRPDTAEVIPTVTREVDAEGVTKAYRGGDAPTGEMDLVRRQQDLAATNPAAAGAIFARAERRPAPGARRRRSGCSGREAGHPLRGCSPGTGRARSARRRRAATGLTDRLSGRVRRSRRRASEALDVRRPYVTVGAEHVLRLDSADGSLAAHRPTSRRCPRSGSAQAATRRSARRPRRPFRSDAPSLPGRNAS